MEENKITWSTMLIQKEDGQLYFKEGENETLASLTDVCKHYRNMQYNIITTFGCYATDASKTITELIGEDKFEELFFKLEFGEQPDFAQRIK